MNTEKEFTVPYSQKKVLSTFWETFLVLAIVCTLFLLNLKGTHMLNIFLNLIGIFFIGVLLFALTHILSKLRDRSPGLVLSSQGVLYNVPAVFPRIFPWKSIENLYVREVRTTQFIALKLRHPNQFLSQMNLISRFFWRINTYVANGIIYISSNVLDIEFEEMAKIAIQYFEKYRDA
jgi:hypothetical protein